MLHEDLTSRIIKAFYKVYNHLGFGFLEKVYENALSIELNGEGLKAKQQELITVLYNGQPVGNYYADILVEGKVILELKAAESIADEHYSQVLNYLKATGVKIGLILNFGRKPEVKRVVWG